MFIFFSATNVMQQAPTYRVRSILDAKLFGMVASGKHTGKPANGTVTCQRASATVGLPDTTSFLQ
jgi:hypothetical protein